MLQEQYTSVRIARNAAADIGVRSKSQSIYKSSLEKGSFLIVPLQTDCKEVPHTLLSMQICMESSVLVIERKCEQLLT